MPFRKAIADFAVYRALCKTVSQQMTFTELRRETGKTSRVVSYQLRRLQEAGVVVHRTIPGGSDHRSSRKYQIGPGWPWIEEHRRVMSDVAGAISSRRVFYDLVAGTIDPGVNGILVYNDLIVEAEDSLGDDSCPSGTHNARKVKRALRAVREALKGEDPNGYHWQFLLRRVIAEIVTSQPRPYFLLSYPASCFGQFSEITSWPDPHWTKMRLAIPAVPKGLRPHLSARDQALVSRFGVEYLGFRRLHLRRKHGALPRCNCHARILTKLFERFRRRRLRALRDPAKAAQSLLGRAESSNLQAVPENGIPPARAYADGLPRE